MSARVELREISNEEGNRLLRMIRRSSGSVVTWRRAQIVLLAAQRMPPPRIAEVVFTDPDTVRDVIHNFNRDGFDALYPRYRGGRPRTFTLPERQQIKRIASSVPTDLGQPFATWSLAKLADYLVAEEVVTDISHEGLRQLLREEGVSACRITPVRPAGLRRCRHERSTVRERVAGAGVSASAGYAGVASGRAPGVGRC